MHSPLQKARDIFLFNSELSRKEITSGKKCFFSYICCFIRKQAIPLLTLRLAIFAQTFYRDNI